MKNKSLLAKNLSLFYDDMSKKRKMEKEMRIQADKEFEQEEKKN